jgi:hypothetical protein
MIESFANTAAEIGRSRIERGGWPIDLWCPGFEGPLFESVVTVVIDDGISKDAEEPGVGGVAGLERACLRHSASVSDLQDVFGGRAVLDSAADKGKEAATLLCQIGNNFLHSYSMLGGRAREHR